MRRVVYDHTILGRSDCCYWNTASWGVYNKTVKKIRWHHYNYVIWHFKSVWSHIIHCDEKNNFYFVLHKKKWLHAEPCDNPGENVCWSNYFQALSGLLRRLRNLQSLATNNKKKPEPKGVKTLPFLYQWGCVWLTRVDSNVYIWRTLNNFHKQLPSLISPIM